VGLELAKKDRCPNAQRVPHGRQAAGDRVRIRGHRVHGGIEEGIQTELADQDRHKHIMVAQDPGAGFGEGDVGAAVLPEPAVEGRRQAPGRRDRNPFGHADDRRQGQLAGQHLGESVVVRAVAGGGLARVSRFRSQGAPRDPGL